MPNELPLLEVRRMIDGHARKILEGGGADEEIIVDPDDRWVRIEARKNGVWLCCERAHLLRSCR